MQRFFLMLIFCFSILPSSAGFADPVPIPGQFASDPFYSEKISREIREHTDIYLAVLEKLNNRYQNDISGTTVHRCPFKTSCSAFFIKSVDQTNVVAGSIVFMDRYFYRENPSAYSNYSYYRTDENIIKLNDDYYLPHGIDK